MSRQSPVVLLLIGLSGCASDSVDDHKASYELLEAEQLRALAAEREVRRKALLESFPEAGARAQGKSGEPAASESSAESPPAITTKSYQAWRLTGYPDPLTGAAQCALVSERYALRNGALDTSGYLVVTATQTFLRADATLDISPAAAGMQVDAGETVRFDKTLNDVTAVVQDQHEVLVDQLRKGRRLQVRFAYQPQHGGQATYQVEFALEGFSEALTALRACDAAAAVGAD